MWRDLSSAELRSRLVNRGFDPGAARLLVEHRDRCVHCWQVIDRALAR